MFTKYYSKLHLHIFGTLGPSLAISKQLFNVKYRPSSVGDVKLYNILPALVCLTRG